MPWQKKPSTLDSLGRETLSDPIKQKVYYYYFFCTSSRDSEHSSARNMRRIFPTQVWQHFSSLWVMYSGHTAHAGHSEGQQVQYEELNRKQAGTWPVFVYLVEVWVGQQMQLARLEAVLTLAFVENIRLEFPTRVFFCSRHVGFFYPFFFLFFNSLFIKPMSSNDLPPEICCCCCCFSLSLSLFLLHLQEPSIQNMIPKHRISSRNAFILIASQQTAFCLNPCRATAS